MLDENIDPRLRNAIHQSNDDVIVWIVGDPGAPPHGTLDPTILEWCDDNFFTLVTKNRASMPVHLADHVNAGGTCPSILVLSPEMSLGNVANDLLLIWEAADSTEFENQIIYLPI